MIAKDAIQDVLAEIFEVGGGVPEGVPEPLSAGVDRLVTPLNETVGVQDSSTRYTTTMDITIGDKPAHLLITGVALRQKFVVNV